MSTPLTAEDLVPIIARLSHDEQVRLAKIALRAAASSSYAETAAYRTAPPGPTEFTSDDEALAWEADGWEGVDATR